MNKMTGEMKTRLIAAAIIIVVIAGIIFSVRYWISSIPVQTGEAGSEGTLPVLSITGIIAGIIWLVIILSAAASVFSLLKLADSKYAFGLPRGSIRAIIALSLIIVLVVGGAAFYSDLARVDSRPSKELTKEQLDSIPRAQILSQEPNKDDPSKYDIVMRIERSQASQDLAKQIIAAVIASVTTLVGFYFGSRSAESAQEGGKETATLKVLSPGQHFKSGAGPQKVPVVLESTPKGEAVAWDPPAEDKDGSLVQLQPNVFEYARGKTPPAQVTLKFRLINHPEVTADLTVDLGP